MQDVKELYETVTRQAPPRPNGFERMLRRRDRKRRNQRIWAGVVGIAVFVAAVWIVTSVGSLDRSETSVVPGGDVTGPAQTGPTETGPAETAPPPPLASGAPDVVKEVMCSDGARARLEKWFIGGLSKVRFEVHRSPVGHEWRIRLVYLSTPPGVVFLRGTRVASDGGDIVVQHSFRHPKPVEPETVRAKARDRQTGEFCNVRQGGF